MCIMQLMKTDDAFNNKAIDDISPKPSLQPDLEHTALSYLALRRGRNIRIVEKPLKRALGNIIPQKKGAKPNRLKELQANWEVTAGDKLAKLCFPESLRGKTATLRANGSAVPMLQMRAKEILGIISLATGTTYGALKFIQAPIKKNVTFQKGAKVAKPIIPLDSAEIKNIEGKLQNIQSDSFKRAIINLSTIIKNKD